MKKTDTNVALIREYFGSDRKVEMPELKELSPDERQELGDMIRETLPE